MWRDGFSVDDGDIRHYNDPQHREFLQSVMKGQIPPELVKEAKGGEVNVDMEDHRDEEFVKPKVKAKPFQGTGEVDLVTRVVTLLLYQGTCWAPSLHQSLPQRPVPAWTRQPQRRPPSRRSTSTRPVRWQISRSLTAPPTNLGDNILTVQSRNLSLD